MTWTQILQRTVRISGPASNNASVGTETSIPVMNAHSGTAGVQMSLFSDEDELALERSELGGFDAEYAGRE